MRRLLLALIVMAALPAQAETIRYPKLGAHAFSIELPRGWKSTTDKRGGLLLVSPDNHAMIYLAIASGAQFRGQPESAVAGDVAKLAGIRQIEAQAPAQIADLRGTAYFGELADKPGFARKAKIVLVRLAPDVWAQQWIVTQAGMNAVERASLERALAGISLLRD